VSRVLETSAPGEEQRIAEHVLSEGVATIVAVGGDGTCSGIANAIVGRGSQCRLAVVPSGTGNDFAKTLGVEKLGPAAIADLLQTGERTSIDVGLVDGRYFLNSCGFGFDAAVLAASNRIHWLKGDAVYIYAALKQLLVYKGREVSVSGCGGVAAGAKLMICVSNGRWLGGAFNIAPAASSRDGRLNACFIGDSGVFERVMLFARALRGTHLRMSSVASGLVTELILTFSEKPSMEVDGELVLAATQRVRVSCVPGALAVTAAAGHPV
jgi:diacylglycerol kinase (ATP)